MLTPSEIASTSSAAYFDMAYGSSGGERAGGDTASIWCKAVPAGMKRETSIKAFKLSLIIPFRCFAIGFGIAIL